MTDAFYTMLGIVLPILIVQLVQLRQSTLAAKKADESAKAAEIVRTDMAVKLDEVHQQTQSIVAHSGVAPLDTK